uniref:F-box/LRR-repeat protein 25 isoform X1 n=1 Tax=Nicotiana tabacum TaxID=4097 RepID=A0A1S3X2A6_TOBAC|nr:PREDICTED: F-box/LRR-repeat protein 25-like isoform X1 [Nicotiana tabacum]
MEMQRKIMARGDRDRLSDLPDPILLDILSLLPEGKAVVRTSVLSQRWRFIWKSVTVSLDFEFPRCSSRKETLDRMASINRELHHWRYCEKIRKIRVFFYVYCKHYVKDIDLWVEFATKIANVEDFALDILGVTDIYEFPQFAFKNTSFKNLVLSMLKVNPSGSVNWSSLISLSIGDLNLTEDVMEKILSGCPNLECLKLDSVKGIRRLEISSVKLRELIIEDQYFHNHDFCFEILGPYIQNLQILSFYSTICLQQRNVASLLTAFLGLEFGQRNLKKECSYLKELLHSVAHVENLELSPWCIELFAEFVGS